MKLFEIVLPLLTNAGLSYEKARMSWEAFTTAQAGGFTRLPWADGAWLDPATKRIHAERVAPYRIACDQEVASRIIDKTFELFPDQLAVMVSEIGTAQIIARQQVPA